jgi:hypothetical protein
MSQITCLLWTIFGILGPELVLYDAPNGVETFTPNPPITPDDGNKTRCRMLWLTCGYTPSADYTQIDLTAQGSPWRLS